MLVSLTLSTAKPVSFGPKDYVTEWTFVVQDLNLLLTQWKRTNPNDEPRALLLGRQEIECLEGWAWHIQYTRGAKLDPERVRRDSDFFFHEERRRTNTAFGLHIREIDAPTWCELI